MSTAIRPITPADLKRAVALVHELATYENAPDECHLSVAQLDAALFSEAPALFGHVATVDEEVVGLALWFLNFSTWRGTHGIYLEDLYVSPEHRGLGLGRELLATLARECVARGYGRLEWTVLDWNEPYFFWVAQADDAPGLMIIGFALGLVATSALLLMLVLRELLRRATALRAEIDEVM